MPFLSALPSFGLRHVRRIWEMIKGAIQELVSMGRFLGNVVRFFVVCSCSRPILETGEGSSDTPIGV
jgi:hypothetical protein